MLPVVDPHPSKSTVFFSAYRAAVRLSAQACLDDHSTQSLDSLDDVSACYVRKGWREFLAANAPDMLSTHAMPAPSKAHRPRFSSRSGTSVDITPPFRQVDFSRFPDGTKVHPIQGSDHCAILAISDALTVIHADATRFQAFAASPEQAQQLLHAHARFMYELAQVGLSALSSIHIQNWHPRALLDAPSDIAAAPSLLALMACTEAGIASLALQWASVAYVRSLSLAPLEGEALSESLDRQIAHLDSLRRSAFDHLLVMNQNTLQTLRIPPRTHASQAVFRSNQHTFPVLALVPLASPSPLAPRELSQL